MNYHLKTAAVVHSYFTKAHTMATQPTIKVIIVDDHVVVRTTWKTILNHRKEFEVIGECSSGQEAIEAARNIKPDVILMDINMSPMNGFDATKEIVKDNPQMKIIGVSLNDGINYDTEMLKNGARVYVTKNSPIPEMVQAIIEVHNGKTYLCREIEEKVQKN